MIIFDPNAFLDANITEPNEKRPPLPEQNPDSPDGLYTALIGEITVKSGMKDEKSWLSMSIPLKIDVPPALQESTKLPERVTLTDRAFIDLTEAGTIDNAPGRNRKQAEYRKACDLNKPGDSFSWRNLTGKVVKVALKHELYQDNVQENIKAVFSA